jgi:copper chaperone NosL
MSDWLALRTIAAALLLAACTNDNAAVEPVWGKEPCAQCGMVVGDRRFGAQLVTDDGDHMLFDDVGCMVAYIDAKKIAPRRMWAHDADTGAWLDARSARYIGGAPSPMDYGFEAHAHGGVAWDEMSARAREKAKADR